VYISDTSRTHGAAAEMTEADMNPDLQFLINNASSVYAEMRKAAEKAVQRGHYYYAASLFRIAGSAARIAAERDQDMEDYFYNRSVDCDANACYFESLADEREKV